MRWVFHQEPFHGHDDGMFALSSETVNGGDLPTNQSTILDAVGKNALDDGHYINAL